MAKQLLVMIEMACGSTPNYLMAEEDIITFASQPFTKIRNICLRLFSQVQVSIR